MGWERANVFAPAGTAQARARLHLGQAELAAVVGRRAAGHPHRRRALRPDLVRQAADHRPRRRERCCSGCARPTSPSRSDGRSTPACSTRAAVTRPTSPSPGSPPTSTCSSPSSASVVRDRDWISRHIAPDQHVSVVDVSSAYAVYGVMGPKSRELLQTLSRADLSDDGLPVRDQPRDRPRLLDRARDPHHLRRRTGLGALRADRVRRRRVRAADAAGRRVRPGPGAATTRSTRCGWRRATARSAPS